MYVYLCGNEGGEEKNSKGWSKVVSQGERGGKEMNCLQGI